MSINYTAFSDGFWAGNMFSSGFWEGVEQVQENTKPSQGGGSSHGEYRDTFRLPRDRSIEVRVRNSRLDEQDIIDITTLVMLSGVLDE